MEVISTFPKYCKIFENINIFNSILIMMINNYYIKEKINKKKEKIKEIDNIKKECLVSILYYLYKYSWYHNIKEDISESDLVKKYYQYINLYSTENCQNEPENYCYNANDTSSIINFIYFKVNKEFNNPNISQKFENLNKFSLISDFYGIL